MFIVVIEYMSCGSYHIFARSLFVVEDIKKGEIITNRNVRSIRPGYGAHPKYLEQIIGKVVLLDLSKGTPLNINDCDL